MWPVSQSYWAVLSCGTVCKAVGSDSIFLDLSQIKDTELIIQYTSKFESRSKSYSATIQMRATGQYFPVVLFIMLYKVICGWNHKVWLLKWQLLNSTFLCGTVYHAVQGGSNFWVCGWNHKVLPGTGLRKRFHLICCGSI